MSHGAGEEKVGVASTQVMNINRLSACANESAGEAESPDRRVSAGGEDRGVVI